MHVLILLSHPVESQRTRERPFDLLAGPGMGMSNWCGVVGIRNNNMNDSVLRAIEMTKRRQSADREPTPSPLTASAVRRKAARPIRTHPLDVERMNLLIKTLDKAWAMPKLNSREPIGSNFQYKKTCASIYKARYGACQQSGFGIMCFNYCYEQGESLEFKCEDLSDANYCKSNGHYDEFLTKYRKDAYRAKAYLHQMISRCYATAVCNADTGILNSTLVLRATGGAAAHSYSRPAADPNMRPMPASTAQALKGLIPSSSKSAVSRRLRPHGSSAQRVLDRYGSRGGGQRRSGGEDWEEGYRPRRPLNGLHPHEVAEEPESGEHVTPKYVPYWRRLLVRKRTTPSVPPSTTTSTPPTTRAPPVPNAEDDSLDDWEIEELEHRMLIAKTPIVETLPINTDKAMQKRLVEGRRLEGPVDADHE